MCSVVVCGWCCALLINVVCWCIVLVAVELVAALLYVASLFVWFVVGARRLLRVA